MKKVILMFFMLILLIPVSSVFADTPPEGRLNVLSGKVFTYGPTENKTSVFTDGDLSTSLAIKYGGSVYSFNNAYNYTFSAPTNIAGYATKLTANNYGYFARILLTKSDGTTVDVPNSNDVYKEFPVRNVVSVSVYNIANSGAAPTVSEVKLYIDTTVNTEEDKFFIKDLNYSVKSLTDIVLSWKSIDSQFLKHYNVYQNGVLIGNPKTSSIAVSQLVSGNEYTFRVVPVDTLGKEFTGNTITYKVPVPDTTPPAVPVLKGTAGDGKVNLSWSISPDEDLEGYNLYQDGKKIGSYKGNSALLSGLQNGKEYKFQVTAFDKMSNESAKSNEIKLKPVETPPVATDSEQEAKPDYLLVKWKETPEAVGYIVYLNGKEVGTTGPEAREFKITKEMGYNPNIISKGLVKPKLADGSVGGGNNDTGGYEKPSFGPNDIWTNVMVIVSSMAGFLLLGIVIRFAPRIFRLVKESIQSYRRNTY